MRFEYSNVKKDALDSLIERYPELAYLKKLQALPEKMKDNLCAYLIEKQNTGLPNIQFAALRQYVIEKSYEMFAMDVSRSDRYAPTAKTASLDAKLKDEANAIFGGEKDSESIH